MKRSNQRWVLQVLGASILGLSGVSAVQAQTTGSETQNRYQQEVERCRSGSSGQALETCLQEAGAAKAEAQRNRLAPRNSVDYEQNRLQRCQVFKVESERRTCIERTRQTPSQGSIEGGGVLREYIEVVPGKPATAQ